MSSHVLAASVIMYLVKRTIDHQVLDIRSLVGLEEMDLTEHDEMKLCPLHYAAWYNHPDAVDKLIKYRAGEYNHPDAVDKLIKYRAGEYNHPDAVDKLIKYRAGEYNHHDAVDKLIKYRAGEYNHHDAVDKLIKYRASEYNHSDTVDKLILYKAGECIIGQLLEKLAHYPISIHAALSTTGLLSQEMLSLQTFGWLPQSARILLLIVLCMNLLFPTFTFLK